MERVESESSASSESSHHIRGLRKTEGDFLSRQEESKAMGSIWYDVVKSSLGWPGLLIATALGAMSKALATLATQPLIVAKVGLQSRPPPARQGKPFKSFHEVMAYIIEHEGPMALFKGIGPQITKGLLVQGLLMMTKERYVTWCCLSTHV